MVKIATLAFALLFGVVTVSASPRRLSNKGSLYRRAFTELSYEQFQISDGQAGTAEALANAVFSDKFAGVDLTTATESDRDAVNNMARAAVDAEEDFNDAIDAAGGKNTAEGKSLQAGKIMNKVLKLSGELMVLAIDTAKGKPNAEKMAEQQTKLANNIELDQANAGTTATSFLSA